MKIHWAIAPSGVVGNALGYSASNFHLMQALMRLGVDFDENASVRVWYSHPSFFERVDGVTNAVFTMCEGEELSHHFTDAFGKADLIVTPSQFCRDVFRRHTDKPIFVCPLGVDPAVFRYMKRSEPGPLDRFRWLYCGAPNVRKFSVLDDLVARVLWPMMMDGSAELYLKTTGTKWREAKAHILSMGLPFEEPEENLLRAPGLILDNRFLPEEHLAMLYQASHAFLALHMGEGAGLTTLEAMATGLPVVVTDYSGTRDFCNRGNSYPVKAHVGIQNCKAPFEGDPPVQIYAAVPDQLEIERAVLAIMRNYRRARLVGKRASESVSVLTWKNSARRLLEILRSTARVAA